jgi:ribonucleoside-triphosphate reductase
MKWFNQERLRCVLTFPVETMALLTENGDVKDKEYGDFTAEMYAEGHSFFTYVSDNADSLSSCCRLRNEITDNGFSYTLGAGGVSTGSKSVLTINLNRCVQYAQRMGIPYQNYIEDVVDLMHKVQLAYNENLKELQSKGMLPLFDSGYINIGRQYLTIGVNGLVESAEFLGIEISDNPRYTEYVQCVLGIVEKLNKKYRTKGVMFNCEMIPAENVGVKNAKWDKEDGYVVPRDCYNSYFYKVEDTTLNVIDRFRLHGVKYIEHLTGGSALHCNLEEHLSKAQYRQLLKVAAQEGCNYFTFNIPNTICNECGTIDKRYLKECPHCHSTNVDYLTRIIGYMKRVSNFSAARQVEASKRYYATL